jgi:acyl carrier protein
MDDITTRCIEIIARSKNIPADTVTLASTFDELNIDSLDKINISFEVEEAFNIEIPDDALGTLRTVGDMVDGVTRLTAAPAPAAIRCCRCLPCVCHPVTDLRLPLPVLIIRLLFAHKNPYGWFAQRPLRMRKDIIMLEKRTSSTQAMMRSRTNCRRSRD